LNLSEIKAQAEQAKKAVEKTTRDLTRAKNLFADSVATLEQVQNAQTAYDMSIETLKIVEFNQSYSKVIAPESGIVIKQLAREGEIVGPGMPVCVVMGIGQSHWIVKAALTDKDWARIKKGDKSKVRFEAFPDQEFEGQVSKVADMANAGTATLDAEIKLKTTVQKLAAGLISNITIHPSDLKLVTKITIPIEALVSANEGNAIVFVPKDGIALRKTIRIDKILGKEVTISSGLEGVSKIITSGAVYLQDGDKIEIVH
ncbi:MAG: efflux RND transporter periplasmic adaptor subunit, partial [Saprospiraceae bacterium]